MIASQRTARPGGPAQSGLPAQAEAPARRDRRRERHEATKHEIVDAAWTLSREHGLAGWSLRDVATAVGMRAPSLYVYFDSKNALYDAMFADGYAALLHLIAETRLDSDRRARLRQAAQAFVGFGVADPARYQLLFLRTIPGFEPSAESFALAREVLDAAVRILDDVGIDDPAAVDLWTALLSGLSTQQISNDPGGQRWTRLIDRAVEMFLADALPKRGRSPRAAARAR